MNELWIRSQNWIVNTDHVTAVAFDPEGPTIQIYIAGESHQRRGGFSAEGEEAIRLWELWCAISTDVMGDGLTLHPRAKAS
jgi:hypothetical protein